MPDVLDAGDHDGSEQQEGEQVAVADEDGGVAAAAKLDLRRAVGQDQADRGRGAGGRVQLMPELPQFFYEPNCKIFELITVRKKWIIVKLRQGSGNDRQGMAVKAKGHKAETLA